MKARLAALVLSVLAGVLVLLPIPLMDLAMMLPMQFAIGLVSRQLSGRPLRVAGLLPLVLVWGLLGTALGFGLEVSLLIIGKMLLAPFAAVWCYLFAELAMLASPPSDKAQA